jgi:hypothetical protein
MKTKIKKIKSSEFGGLICGRIATYRQGAACIEIHGKGDDKRFVMEGPSGKHSLLVSATDLDRLNAHWANFAADSRNAY